MTTSKKDRITLVGIEEITGSITDYTSFNTEISPLSLSMISIFDNLQSGGSWNWLSQYTMAESLGMGAIQWNLSPVTGTLNAFSAGTYDTQLAAIGAAINSFSGTVYIRICGEFNGTWQTFGNGNETAAQFIAGWQHVVTKLKLANTNHNAKYVWEPYSGWTMGWGAVVDPTTWYPGNTYVDVLGLDVYWNDAAFPGPYSPYGMKVPGDIASMRAAAGNANMPVCFPECGCDENAALSTISPPGKAGWITDLLAIAFADPNFIYLCWWNEVHGAYDYSLSSSGTNSASVAAFVAGVKTLMILPATPEQIYQESLKTDPHYSYTDTSLRIPRRRR